MPWRDNLVPYNEPELHARGAPEILTFGNLMNDAYHLMGKFRVDAAGELLRLDSNLATLTYDFHKVARLLKERAGVQGVLSHLSTTRRTLQKFADKVPNDDVDALAMGFEETSFNPVGPSSRRVRANAVGTETEASIAKSSEDPSSEAGIAQDNE